MSADKGGEEVSGGKTPVCDWAPCVHHHHLCLADAGYKVD